MTFLPFLSFAIILLAGLISIFIGIWIAGRCAGKLRHAVVFLIIAVIILLIKESVKIVNFLSETNLLIARVIGNVSIIIFILLALFSMKQMINFIDNNHENRKKK